MRSNTCIGLAIGLQGAAMWLELLNAPSLAQFVIAPGRKDHSIVSFMAFRIIRGDMCWETFQNVRFEEMGLGWCTKRNIRRSAPGAMEHRRCRGQEALREAGILQRHRRHLGPPGFVRSDPEQARNRICWGSLPIAGCLGSRIGRKMTKLPRPFWPNSGWNWTYR